MSYGITGIMRAVLAKLPDMVDEVDGPSATDEVSRGFRVSQVKTTYRAFLIVGLSEGEVGRQIDITLDLMTGEVSLPVDAVNLAARQVIGCLKAVGRIQGATPIWSVAPSGGEVKLSIPASNE